MEYDFPMRLACIAAVPILVLATAAAHAQPYRWVDEKGRVQYSDTPPAKGKVTPRSAQPVAPRPVAAPPPATEGPEPVVPFAVQRAQKDFPVTLYTSPSCKEPCELARTALNRRGVPFSEVQVWDNETVELLKARTGGDSVPSLSVGRTSTRGFEQGEYDSLLDSAGYPAAGSVPARNQKAPPPPEGYTPPQRDKAQPVVPAEAPKTGPYDPSGLKSNVPDRPGRYGVPDAAK